jgi:hypothetical protein
LKNSKIYLPFISRRSINFHPEQGTPLCGVITGRPYDKSSYYLTTKRFIIMPNLTFVVLTAMKRAFMVPPGHKGWFFYGPCHSRFYQRGPLFTNAFCGQEVRAGPGYVRCAV